MNRIVKILEKFLTIYFTDNKINEVCDAWVDDEPDDDGLYWVYIVLDRKFVEGTKPEFVVKRIKQGLKKEIKDYLGLNVEIGVTTKDCDNTENINESISSFIRRRLSFENMKQDIDNLVDYELNPCEFSDIGDFVAEACDLLAHNYLEDLQVSSKDKDGFYISLVDLFGKYLVNLYKKRCKKGLTESKNKIILTESQYKRLFEEKKSKVDIFQELINNKLEYIKKNCNNSSETFPNDIGFSTCDIIDMIDSIKVDNVQILQSGSSDMYGNTQNITPTILIKVLIYYSNIKYYDDFDDVVYDLKHMLKQSTGGLPIVFEYYVYNNKNNSEW